MSVRLKDFENEKCDYADDVAKEPHRYPLLLSLTFCVLSRVAAQYVRELVLL